MSKTLTIDKEFEAICPSLTPEEFNLLEHSIIEDGCLFPIIVWANHEDTILDGHNRYKMCTRWEKPFKTKALKFDTRDDAIEWIKHHALGQRNMTEQQKSAVRGREYEKEKLARGGAKKAIGHGGQMKEPIRTRNRIAKKHGVGSRTIERDAKFANALDVIENTTGKEAKNKILKGECKLTKMQVVKAATLSPAKQKRAIETGKLPAGSEGRPTGLELVSTAMEFARMSISQLERIDPKDKDREKAFCRVEQWINDERKRK